MAAGTVRLTWREHQQLKLQAAPNAASAAAGGTIHSLGYPCGKQHGATSWLNEPSVRTALHVPPESFYGYRYYLDQIEPPFNYTSNVPSLVGTYLRLIPKYKVLIYNGDLDPCVPYNGNEEWCTTTALPAFVCPVCVLCARARVHSSAQQRSRVSE